MKFLKFILLAIISLALSGLALLGFLGYKVSVSHDRHSIESVTIIIERGESFKGVARKLEDEGIISNDLYFVAYGVLEKNTGGVKAGVYELSPLMSIKNIMETMIGGDVVDGSVRVTFPEGFSSTQIAQRLHEEGIIESETEFMSLVAMSSSAAHQIYEYDFLRDINAPSLHGFLFPDTYDFMTPQRAEDVLDKFLANFQQKAGHVFRENSQASGQASNYSPFEILIMASILEREVQTEEDMKLAAGALYNRLEIDMPLQVDASLVYITGKVTGQLTAQDKLINHPYNTYVYRGLPPGPISNPGLKAINAALNPTPNEYLYYLSAEDGTTIFGKTLEEHNRNREEYLDYLRR